jgi:uncharacterized repeat protein (TIGR03803 family)
MKGIFYKSLNELFRSYLHHIIIVSFLLLFINPSSFSQCSEFYGMTTRGGDNDLGTIFKTDGEGKNLTTIYNFAILGGADPQGSLTQAYDGKLFGMTYGGGEFNFGELFEFNPVTNKYITKIVFNGSENGCYPVGSLMRADNGKMYGMTSQGGKYNDGVLFEWDPVNAVFTKKIDFNSSENGKNPFGTLVQCCNGKFYGVTTEGGAVNAGILFEWDSLTNKLTKKYDFSSNEAYPTGTLVMAGNGKLYGTTLFGGTNGKGTLFEWDPTTEILVRKIEFNVTEYGESPYGSLMLASNGKLYGMAEGGGTNGNGVIFEYNPSTDIFTKKHDFNFSDGHAPFGSLIEANDGLLYGMTKSGGAYKKGILFELDPVSCVFTKKLDFNGKENGSFPMASLLQAENGLLYGMTSNGGVMDHGIIFEWNPSVDTCIKKYDFYVPANGMLPNGSLTRIANNKLYGMTTSGGMFNYGVLFELDLATNTFTKKFDFDGLNNGSYPYGSILQASDGFLYGVTAFGGANDYGVLFVWDSFSNYYTKLIDFNGTQNGSRPFGTLIQAGNGKIYGLTSTGGKNNKGVLFEWNPDTKTFLVKLEFNGTENGSAPYGSLIQATNGKLYGMTAAGGIKDYGVLFEYDPVTDTYSKKIDLNGIDNGSFPFGSLLEAGNGKLYGTTEAGGKNGKGVFFEWDPINEIVKKIVDFDGIGNGKNPEGSVIQASNGKLYSIIKRGGKNDRGIIFEWDPVANIFKKVTDFNHVDHENFVTGNLLEISNPSRDTINIKTCGSYKSPSGNYDFTSSGIYQDFLDGKNGCDSIITIYLTINQSTASTIMPRSCNNYISPSGRFTWEQSGTYIDTIPNASGCDSIITINLTVNHSSFSTIQPNACGSYTSPSGRYIWTTSGTYSDTIPNASGCDSIITIELNILNIDPTISVYGTNITSKDSIAHHQWVNCDNNYTIIPGETGQSFSPEKEGNYAVIVKYGWCADTSVCVSIDMTSILPNTSEQNISIFPNPTYGRFTIDLGRMYEEATITITELDGRVVLRKTAESAQKIELIMDSAPGIYLVNINTENSNRIYRIVKSSIL